MVERVLRPRVWIPLAVFAVFFAHGALTGLSDDEAYYWVLAQRPALGYAFHPPMIGWIVAASRAIFGWCLGPDTAACVRMPAAVMIASAVGFALAWMEEAGADSKRLWRGALALASFAGFSVLAWMVVPDTPLFFGWTLAFYSVWGVCGERNSGPGPGWMRYFGITLGIAFAMLGKYSGVLACASVVWAVLLFAPRERWLRTCIALVAGVLLALAPIMIWNSSHEWSSLLYQLRARHEGSSISLGRYARFWLTEIAVAGPWIVAVFFISLKQFISRASDKASQYCMIWALPGAAVFCVEPLVADFKAHWVFIVWWPVAISLGLAWSRANALEFWSRMARRQCVYGAIVVILLSSAFYVPWIGLAMRSAKGDAYDPRWDATNDFYGWEGLRAFLDSKIARSEYSAVVGSRYQTAAQAAFALRDSNTTTLIPRDIKARDEWPEPGVSDTSGPAWPHLTKPIVYVADNRYDMGPQFPDARCTNLGRMETYRMGLIAKWVTVWRCQ